MLERLAAPSPHQAFLGEESEASEGAVVLELRSSTDELAGRQRLIEEALRQSSGSEEGPSEEEMKPWQVGAPPEGGVRPVDLQDASRRAFEWAQKHARGEDERAPREWSVAAEEEASSGLPLRPVEESEPSSSATPEGHVHFRARPADVGLEVKALVSEDMTALVAEVVSPVAVAEEPPRAPMLSPDAFRSYEDQDSRPAQEEPPGSESRSEDRALDRARSHPGRSRRSMRGAHSAAALGWRWASWSRGPTGSFICARVRGRVQRAARRWRGWPPSAHGPRGEERLRLRWPGSWASRRPARCWSGRCRRASGGCWWSDRGRRASPSGSSSWSARSAARS